MTALQERLTSLARRYGVPGASLAVSVDGRVATAATGVLNLDTGVEVTSDSVFQLGSITKVYTALAIMRLVEAGRLVLDAPVIDALPEFRVADPDVTRTVTARHLLTHTSGLAGDHFADTGRGDDAVQRFVTGLADVGQDVPIGTVFSYSNTGFVVLGRVLERLTEQVWDRAIRELVASPLGLDHTVSLPEDVLRFRSAYGHVGDVDKLQLAPVSCLPRAISPAGAMWASAGDLVAFGQLFLDGGRASDGTRVVSEGSVAEMLRPQVPTPGFEDSADARGLGWAVLDRGGRRVFEHGGGTPGQRAFFEAVPDRGVALALLTNGGRSREMAHELYRDLHEELCGLETPSPPEPVLDDRPVDAAAILGRYERYGSRTDLWLGAGGMLQATAQAIEPLASQLPFLEPSTSEVYASTAGANVYVTREEGSEEWIPLVFVDIAGERYLLEGGRAQRKVA